MYEFERIDPRGRTPLHLGKVTKTQTIYPLRVGSFRNDSQFSRWVLGVTENCTDVQPF